MSASQGSSGAAIRQAWGTVREEARRYDVALGTMHTVMGVALRRVQRFWRQGERGRFEKLRLMADADLAFRQYRRARASIRAGTIPVDVDGAVMKLALESVRAAWWQHPEPGGAAQRALVAAAVRISLLRLSPGHDTELELEVQAARLGLDAEAAQWLRAGMDDGFETGLAMLRDQTEGQRGRL